MKLNPTILSWKAPTTNVDGAPIDYELEYEVGADDGKAYVPLMTIPGQLRQNENYEAPISDLLLDYGEHTIALRSFDKSMPDRMSEWSEPVTFTLATVPSRPLELRVT